MLGLCHNRVGLYRAVAAALLLLGVAGPSAAIQINQAQVVPPTPTTPFPVLIRSELMYPSSGYSFSQLDITYPSPDQIEVKLLVVAPGIQIVQPVLVFETIDAPLGVLAEGQYDYTVQLYELPAPGLPGSPPPGPLDGFLVDTRTGQFSVVPEPASLTLLIAGGLTLSRRRRAS